MPTDRDSTDVLTRASNERRASTPAPCSGPSSLQPEAACGAQAQPSTERVRIAPAGLGLDGTAPDTLPAAPGGSETHPWRMPRGERLDCVAGLWLEVHMNSDTLEMRHCFVPLEECLRFHRGYTEADAEAGWRHTIAAPAAGFSDESIEWIKVQAQSFHRAKRCEAASCGRRSTVAAYDEAGTP